MDDHGLDDDGTIRREGALDRVAAPFAAVVATAGERVAATFEQRLHSAYLYGSIPRGTAVVGRSDLDLALALHDEPSDAERADAVALETDLDAAFDQIDGVGVVLFSVATALSAAERHDLGFFVACLCTPLLGPDLAGALPRYRPTSELARETNGNLADLLPGWRERATAAVSEAEHRSLRRGVARRIVRTGFTLIMPRWGGWTCDLDVAAALFGRYYPGRREQMVCAANVAREPSSGPGALTMLLDDLGPWLAAEHIAVHGTKQPR